jgi:hypothetical protein
MCLARSALPHYLAAVDRREVFSEDQDRLLQGDGRRYYPSAILSPIYNPIDAPQISHAQHAVALRSVGVDLDEPALCRAHQEAKAHRICR